MGRRLVGRSRSHRGLNKGGGGGCACAQRRGGGGALGESAGLVLRRPRACGGVAGGTPLRPALRSRSPAGAPYAGRARSWAFGFVKVSLTRKRARASLSKGGAGPAPPEEERGPLGLWVKTTEPGTHGWGYLGKESRRFRILAPNVSSPTPSFLYFPFFSVSVPFRSNAVIWRFCAA